MSAVLLVVTALPLSAQYWTSFENNTRYLALGDSISASYGAKPVTQGFTHQLYQSGVFDNTNNLIFCSLAVPNALSADVLGYQAPMARLCFAPTGVPYPKFVTLSVGGNDAFLVLEQGAPPAVVFANLAANLTNIIGTLRAQFPGVKIYIMNYWDPKLPIPGERGLVLALNFTIGAVVAGFLSNDVVLVDVFSAFEGRDGLLLIERNGSSPLQIHPTNAGYQVIAAAFTKAITGK
ncbi:MAG: SGNH/GDSL hydrolase family protein [Candidatus Solibacter usitatus]|nr:SGNH/GDSL hydrolase family protein [Candidatus Solibacter usitatus]